ncbi:MAG: hypothetical protein IKC85_00835, partial [Bacteroidaceae bacterium]|nr:hypothetical protein [Bacteroidaceae bacterium]
SHVWLLLRLLLRNKQKYNHNKKTVNQLVDCFFVAPSIMNQVFRKHNGPRIMKASRPKNYASIKAKYSGI